MSIGRIIVDDIYWERVQLFIKGHTENLNTEGGNFVLRNLTETKVLEANDVYYDGASFLCRFNVAILDDGSYLPPDEYLLVYSENMEYISQINNDLIIPNYEDMTEQEIDIYENKSTESEKYNYLLKAYKKVFKQGGTSNKITYTVEPKISKQVNEFVLNITYNGRPKKKDNFFLKKFKKARKTYNKYSYKVRNFAFKTIFNISKAMRTRKGNTVLFTSDSRASMSGNFAYIYNEMLKQDLDNKYDIHQIFKSNITERRNLKDKFLFPYFLGKSDYIFVDDFHPLIYDMKFKKNQEIIQVWHAVGAFKTVGFSRTGKRGGPFFHSRNHRNYTKVYVSSETDIPFYAEAFGVKERNVIPTGVPRTDILFDKEYENRIVNEMREELPIIKNKKVILFAPTFRGNGHKTAHYPFFKIDFKRLALYCEENNAVVLFKMHPFVKNKLVIPRVYQDYFIDASEFREVNDILFITDILISDYSSIIYEFSAFKRPMLFYAFDLEDYITSRDFYEPYEEFVPGKIVETFDELIDTLYKEDFEQEKVPRFLDKHFKYQDGKSSERLVKDLFGSSGEYLTEYRLKN